MQISELITGLQREGDLLSAAAARTDLDTPIPTCPAWTMRDLVRHIGGVHRWATPHVAERLLEPVDGIEAVVPVPPEDDVLIDWFVEGHAALVHALAAADPELTCWTFLPAPSPLAFWARRQAHETGMHRVDAESPGGSVTPFPPAFAEDGINELLYCFASRPGGKLRSDVERTLHFHATDVDRDWLVRIGPESVRVTNESAEGGCGVRGSASDLHLLLWNRRGTEGLEVRGNSTLLHLWRDSVHIRWKD
jgi:uncharacterized protein (TIGR03083 family)